MCFLFSQFLTAFLAAPNEMLQAGSDPVNGYSVPSRIIQERNDASTDIVVVLYKEILASLVTSTLLTGIFKPPTFLLFVCIYSLVITVIVSYSVDLNCNVIPSLVLFVSKLNKFVSCRFFRYVIKRKHKTLSLEEKTTILRRMKNGEITKIVAKEFAIGK
jgi:hypothetical protein